MVKHLLIQFYPFYFFNWSNLSEWCQFFSDMKSKFPNVCILSSLTSMHCGIYYNWCVSVLWMHISDTLCLRFSIYEFDARPQYHSISNIKEFIGAINSNKTCFICEHDKMEMALHRGFSHMLSRRVICCQMHFNRADYTSECVAFTLKNRHV